MTGDKNLFSTLEEKDLQMRIEMGNDGKYHVSSEGMVVFQRYHVAPLTLTDVIMYRTKRIGIRVKNLYKLEVDDCVALSSKAELVQSKDVGELWHRILGHLHHGALKIMQMISTGLPKGKMEKMDTCKGFSLGKYAKYSFQDRDSRAGEILERVHTDVCGPFSTASTAKQRYYVIFIDDFSHRCWIYSMQKKDQTFSRFCEFKALADKESGKKIRALRSDNGGEYVSR
eukprot:PITA_33062